MKKYDTKSFRKQLEKLLHLLNQQDHCICASSFLYFSLFYFISLFFYIVLFNILIFQDNNDDEFLRFVDHK